MNVGIRDALRLPFPFSRPNSLQSRGTRAPGPLVDARASRGHSEAHKAEYHGVRLLRPLGPLRGHSGGRHISGLRGPRRPSEECPRLHELMPRINTCIVRPAAFVAIIISPARTGAPPRRGGRHTRRHGRQRREHPQGQHGTLEATRGHS